MQETKFYDSNLFFTFMFPAFVCELQYSAVMLLHKIYFYIRLILNMRDNDIERIFNNIYQQKYKNFMTTFSDESRKYNRLRILRYSWRSFRFCRCSVQVSESSRDSSWKIYNLSKMRNNYFFISETKLHTWPKERSFKIY